LPRATFASERPLNWLALTPDEWTAVRLSLLVASVAMIASLPFGIGVALLLARGRFPGRRLLSGLIYMPLVLPPVVTGFALLLLLGRKGPLGALLESSFGIVFAFRWTGAAVAAAVMGFPLMVRAIQLSIEAVDRRLEQAAGTLGASPAWVLATVTLPLAAPGIVAGMMLSFAKAMGEFGATITFVSSIPGETQTLPSAIHSYLQTPGGDPQALRLSVLSAVISLVALMVSDWLAERASTRIRYG
jgi:molybdate transport system permease protein